jgi:hypothetical protein
MAKTSKAEKELENNDLPEQQETTKETVNPGAELEQAKSEPAPKAPGKKPGRVLVSGAEFLEFKKEGETFIGQYTGRQSIREKDGKQADQKAGDVMGYYFVDKSGIEVIVGNSYAIKKAMVEVKKGDVIYIEFLGQDDLGGGKTVNRLHIAVLEEDEKKDHGF